MVFFRWVATLMLSAAPGVSLAAPEAGLCDVKKTSYVATGYRANAVGAKSYVCYCDSPCSGSKICPNGCYAFCEEDPENSGRYVCIQGCASEAPAVKGKKLDPRKQYASVHISIPREQVTALMLKLYNRKDLRPIVLKADVTEPVHIRLRNADMEALIREMER
jgi:hypothetical protein